MGWSDGSVGKTCSHEGHQGPVLTIPSTHAERLITTCKCAHTNPHTAVLCQHKYKTNIWTKVKIISSNIEK